jgi:hypothetical protein
MKKKKMEIATQEQRIDQIYVTKSSFTIFVIFAYFGKVRQKKEGVYSIQYSRYLYQKRFLI